MIAAEFIAGRDASLSWYRTLSVTHPSNAHD